jgi:uncharacterized protein (DUF2147 family)
MAILVLLLALPVCVRAATPDSPVGRWKTIDDHTGQAKAIVEIREVNGELDGRVVKLFNPPEPHPLCRNCTGALKNKPVMGMQILWGMRQDGNDWTGGRILDPETGNVYRCTMTVENGGKALRLRGYIGFSVFGRTERWLRIGARDK